MATDQEYQGWANWDTWATSLSLLNDEGPYFYWLREARRCADRDTLSEQLRAEVPDSGAVYDDVRWGNVDWDEVADAFIEAAEA